MVQEYSSEWLTDDMLTELINSAIKHISTDTMVLQKTATGLINNSDHITLPADLVNIETLFISGSQYTKINFSDKSTVHSDSNVYYYNDNKIYFLKNISGEYEMLYNNFPEELEESDDELDDYFKGNEKMIFYYVVSEINAMDGDQQRQGFNYRIYELQKQLFIKKMQNLTQGQPRFKYKQRIGLMRR